MTKQQVIDILDAYKPSGNIYNGYNSIEEKIDERICYLIDEIIESIKREPDNDWIKCSERLPEESDGTVLVCFPDELPYSNKEPYVNAKHNQRVRTASYSQFNNTWYIGDFCAIGEVRPIAWMLLPEPPEEEENDT